VVLSALPHGQQVVVGDRCALIAADGADGPCRGSRVVLVLGLAGMGPGVRRANVEQGLIGCGPTSSVSKC
jgi:hypothetical protein